MIIILIFNVILDSGREVRHLTRMFVFFVCFLGKNFFLSIGLNFNLILMIKNIPINFSKLNTCEITTSIETLNNFNQFGDAISCIPQESMLS